MRELTEKETKQKEFIEKKLTEHGIKVDGKYKFKKSFLLHSEKTEPVEITSAVIGFTPLKQQEGVVLFVLCWTGDSFLGRISFVPTNVDCSKIMPFNKDKIFWADYSLSDFDKFISMAEGIELDREYYEKMITKSEEVIASCKFFLND